MSNERQDYEAVQKIFLEALDQQTPEEREAYLEEACAGDGTLRGEINALLKEFEQGSALIGLGSDGEAAGDETVMFLPGTILSHRYRIVSLVGKGAMGEVYRADDLKLEQPVALKFLPMALADNRALLKALYNEVRLARQVSHRNVGRMYDIGETEDGQPFLSMEYIQGEDLSGLLQRIGRLPLDKAIELGMQLCEGLHAAHDEGLLHLDLKPANLMIDGKGNLRITDFGLARLASEAASRKQRGGTPAYMAPEHGKDGEVSESCDLYAVGLILSEMLTGERGHLAGDDEAALALPLELWKLIQDCAEAVPNQRPKSAREMFVRLEGLRAVKHRTRGTARSGRQTAVLFFSDIVDSVGLQKRIGSTVFAEQIQRHDALFHEVVGQSEGGQVLQHTGDGFMISFETASEGVTAALRVQWLFQQEDWPGEPMRLCIGLHMGEVLTMREQNTSELRPVGMATNLAARIMGLAQPSQILMTRAVYDDAKQFVRAHPSASDRDEELQWVGHGAYQLKGNDEPVEIFEVGLPGAAPLTAPAASEKAAPVSAAPVAQAAEPLEVEVLQPETIRNSDVLITFAPVDDHPASPNAEGWISQLHRHLKVRVAQLSGKNVAIVRQSESASQPDLLDEVPAAKTVVSILSPPFVQSNDCREVVKTFWKRTEANGNFNVHDRARLLNVVKTPVEEGDIPSEIQPLYADLIPYDFYERDPETGRVRVFDEAFGQGAMQRFHERVYDVAYDISQVLKYMEQPNESGSALTADRKTIFLATTTSDLDPMRDHLRRELIELGHVVLPRQSLPLVASDLTAAVESCLEQCDLAIHFVGSYFGLVPEATDLSLVALQNQVAARFSERSGLQRLVWVPKGMEPQDERQAAFVKQLELEPELLTGAELVADTMENFKVLLWSRWERDAAQNEASVKSTSAKRVYIICDRQDEEAIEPLEDYFYERGIEVSLPGFEAAASETQQIHIDNLRDCDAALIYYGAAGMHWVDFNIRDLQKAAGYRNSEPIPVSAVCLAPPYNRRKERFKSVSMDVIRQDSETFDPGILDDFVAAIEGGGVVA